MSKELQTVYVPTEYTNKQESFYIKKELIDVAKVREVQSYLYTKEEHQAAQQTLATITKPPKP